MAIFKASLGELSGMVGANVFSHNSGATYVRQKAVPINRNSSRQQLARAALAYCSAQWALLSDNQRALWKQWATLHPVIDRLGNSIVLSGQGAYCQLNSRLRNLGNVVQANPPPANITAYVSTTAVALTTPAAVTITFATTPLPAGIRMELLLSAGTPAGRDPNMRSARWAGATAAAATSPATFTSAVPFTTGAIVNTYVRLTDQYGQSTVPVKQRVTVT
jgi:hypothetical protein